MHVKSLILSAVAAMVTLAPLAKADVFAAADAAYALRANDHAQIATARADYLAILNGTATNAQKIYAATQVGRLDVYEGQMLTDPADKATRKQIFGDCWAQMKAIDPAVVGENAAFYYFKGVCLAYWGQVVSPILSIPNIPMLNTLIAGGETAANQDFEGGGVYRLAAGVHSNAVAASLPGGLYNPQQALTEIQSALASPGQTDPRTHAKVSGQQVYENWRGLAQVYVALNDTANAKLAYQKGIALIQSDEANGLAPKSRQPETAWDLTTMQTELAALGN